MQTVYVCLPSVPLCVCPSLRLSLCASVLLSLYAYVPLGVCPSVRLSLCASFPLSVPLRVCPEGFLDIIFSVRLSGGLAGHYCFCVSVRRACWTGLFSVRLSGGLAGHYFFCVSVRLSGGLDGPYFSVCLCVSGGRMLCEVAVYNDISIMSLFPFTQFAWKVVTTNACSISTNYTQMCYSSLRF